MPIIWAIGVAQPPRHHFKAVLGSFMSFVIGNITSGTMSPTLSKGIGMGYIDSDKSIINSQVGIKIRNKVIAAKIVKTPFVII